MCGTLMTKFSVTIVPPRHSRHFTAESIIFTFCHFRPKRDSALTLKQIVEALETVDPDISFDSDISGASDDSDADVSYKPPGRDLEDSSSDEDEADSVPVEVEADSSSNHGEEVLPAPDAAEPGPSGAVAAAGEPKKKRRRLSRLKPEEREWLEGDLPQQEVPYSALEPKNVDDCKFDVQYFMKTFGTNNMELLYQQSNLFRLQQAANGSKPVAPFTEKEIRQAVGILLYMSVVSMPSMKLYWQQSLRNDMVASVMKRDRFLQIIRNFHLNDNMEQPGKNSPDYDRLYKVNLHL